MLKCPLPFSSMDLQLLLVQQQIGQQQLPSREVVGVHKRCSSTHTSSARGVSLPDELCLLRRRLSDWKALIKHTYSLCEVIGLESEDHRLNCVFISKWTQSNYNRNEVHLSCQVSQFKDFAPIISSVKILPDVVIYTDDKKVPLLLIEVHSSPYKQTLMKMVLVLIEHLRWLRNCDASIVKWSGFCFPKATERTCVSRVDISWDCQNLHFIIDYTPLQLDDVKANISGTIHEHLEIVQKDTFRKPSLPLIGLPLEKESLRIFGDYACQLPSSHSIIVANQEKVYKYIVDPQEGRVIAETFLKFKDTTDHEAYQLPTNILSINSKTFFVFPMLIYPMNRSEAIQCLPNFVKSVAKAIQSMHQGPLQRAHLDIRLENICFRALETAHAAVLIDLDRCKPIDYPVSSSKYIEGVMYKAPEPNWTFDMLDWRQFGYMIVYCLCVMENYHKMTVPDRFKSDNFISKLIDQGEYDQTALQSSVIQSCGTKSLTDVLKERLSSPIKQ